MSNNVSYTPTMVNPNLLFNLTWNDTSGMDGGRDYALYIDNNIVSIFRLDNSSTTITFSNVDISGFTFSSVDGYYPLRVSALNYNVSGQDIFVNSNTWYYTPTIVNINSPFNLTWTDTNTMLGGQEFYLNINNIQVASTFEQMNTTEITFNNVNLTEEFIGVFPISVNSQRGDYGPNYASIDITVLCFLEGTEILCLIDNEEKYIKIEDISDDTMIKTYKHGYKKLLYKSHQKVRNNIVCMKKDSLDTNIPFNDLKVTTGHSMLVDNLTDDEITEIEKWNPVKKIDDKFLILSRVSKYFEEYDTKELNNVYHLILEADDLDTQYGIYANGVLMESMSKRFLNI